MTITMMTHGTAFRRIEAHTLGQCLSLAAAEMRLDTSCQVHNGHRTLKLDASLDFYTLEGTRVAPRRAAQYLGVEV